MRLIDADKLIDNLRGNVLVDVTTELEKAIENQPTAYDVDKIVSQLEKEGNDVFATSFPNKYYEFYDNGTANGLCKAAEIVREGTKSFFQN